MGPFSSLELRSFEADYASSAPPKLEEMNRVESNHFYHLSFTHGNAKPPVIKNHHGPGAIMTDDRVFYQNMVGAYEALLQCGSGVAMVADWMPSKNVESFYEAFLQHNRTSVSSNRRTNSSGNTNHENDTEVSSSSISDNYPKGNSGSSSELLGSSSSGSSKSSSSEIQSSDVETVAQTVSKTTTAVSVEEKRRDTSKHRKRLQAETYNRVSDDSKNLKRHRYMKPTVSLTHPNQNELRTTSLANPWGDIDHLLDGYDYRKKTAIMEERSALPKLGTHGNTKPPLIKNLHGPGATMTDDPIPYRNMVDAYEASLQCGLGASMVADWMSSKNVEGFYEAFLQHNRTSV